MDAQNDTEMVKIEFSILGESFVLSCKAQDEENLKKSINNIKEATAKILRANPNMSPQQAAILTALDSQNQLLTYKQHKSPFILRAQRLIEEIEKNANKVINGQ